LFPFLFITIACGAVSGWHALICDVVTETARLMVGVPDYQTYVDHTRNTHPDKKAMSYEEFFRERQAARYTVGKGRFRGCC
jgi:uncharacterized short protein YbdD (DUF466 family)